MYTSFSGSLDVLDPDFFLTVTSLILRTDSAGIRLDAVDNEPCNWSIEGTLIKEADGSFSSSAMTLKYVSGKERDVVVRLRATYANSGLSIYLNGTLDFADGDSGHRWDLSGELASA